MNEHYAPAAQPALFPLAALQTKGYARPATDDEQAAESDDTGTEEAA